MRLPTIPLLAAVMTLLVATPALADDFVPLPALDKKANSLKIRFVKYTGGTNGEMVVDVKNTGKRTEQFVAESLFFVPDGSPESAPQRLGAAGPFRAEDGDAWIQAEQLALRPGETRRVHLQVFCIDSHRSSPGNEQGFHVARKRLPKQLRAKIDKGAKQILRKNNGDLKKSKTEIQSHIWQSRDGEWIELEGERKVEKAPRSKQRNYRRNELRNQVQEQRREP